MAMAAGRLRHRVDLQSAAESQSVSGEPVETWTTDTVLSASIESGPGRELQSAQEMYPDVTHVVGLRYRAGVTSKQRLLSPREYTTLGTATTSTTGTTIVVAEAIGRDTGDYDLRVDTEDFIVTAGNGTTSLTVTRGAYGTTPATHSSGAAVTYLVPLNIEARIDPKERGERLRLLCRETGE